MSLFLIKRGEKVIGVFDNLSNFFPDNTPKDEATEHKNYDIERLNLNEVTIKPNQIIFKGRNFGLTNIDEPLPLLDVSDPRFL